MWNTIYEIIAVSCVTLLFINAEPMILLKRWMGFREEDICGVYKVRDFFTKLLYCCMCSGFWIGLVFTQNFYQAVIISIISEFIDRKLKSTV
jgi:hypothetical protein